jgi:hypothetical protein
MFKLLGGLIKGTSTLEYRAPLPDGGDGRQWAQPVEVPGCRWEPTAKQHENAQGRVVTLTRHAVMPAAPEIQLGGLLEFEDGEERPVEKVAAPVWLNGQRMHQEVWTS